MHKTFFMYVTPRQMITWITEEGNLLRVTLKWQLQTPVFHSRLIHHPSWVPVKFTERTYIFSETFLYPLESSVVNEDHNNDSYDLL